MRGGLISVEPDKGLSRATGYKDSWMASCHETHPINKESAYLKPRFTDYTPIYRQSNLITTNLT